MRSIKEQLILVYCLADDGLKSGDDIPIPNVLFADFYMTFAFIFIK